MIYIFNLLKLLAIGFFVTIVNLIAIDGKTNWLEDDADRRLFDHRLRFPFQHLIG